MAYSLEFDLGDPGGRRWPVLHRVVVFCGIWKDLELLVWRDSAVAKNGEPDKTSSATTAENGYSLAAVICKSAAWNPDLLNASRLGHQPSKSPSGTCGLSLTDNRLGETPSIRGKAVCQS
jgi:hypothetical protein